MPTAAMTPPAMNRPSAVAASERPRRGRGLLFGEGLGGDEVVVGAASDAASDGPADHQGGAGAEHDAADRSQQAAGLSGLAVGRGRVVGGRLRADDGCGLRDGSGLGRLGLVAVLLLLADLDDRSQHLQAGDGLLAVLELEALVGDELLVVADRGLRVLGLLVDAADVEEDRRLGLDGVGALEQGDGAGVVLVLELGGGLADEGVEGLGLAARAGGCGRCGRGCRCGRGRRRVRVRDEAGRGQRAHGDVAVDRERGGLGVRARREERSGQERGDESVHGDHEGGRRASGGSARGQRNASGGRSTCRA